MIAPRLEVLNASAVEHGGRLALGERALIDFSVCLNAFGPAPIVSRAIADVRFDEYPDPQSRTARRAASDRWQRPMAEIMFGAGAAELIQATCFAYLRPQDDVLVAAPAFGEYRRAAELCGASVQDLWMMDLVNPIQNLVDAIHRVRPRLVFLATPSNPLGHALTASEITHVADACRATDSLLVLDLAYDAFTASPIGVETLSHGDNVLQLRSITKEHAIAGVRAAFALSCPSIISAIERARVPWSASTFAQAAATAAMSHEAQTHVERTVSTLRSEAHRIAGAIRQRGITVRHASTHFMLIQCESARATRDELIQRAGILVRDCTSFGLPQWIRIAARTPDENNLLITALT